MQLKGVSCNQNGPGSSYRALSSPYGGALFNCLIVGHSPGFNCIGPRGASKNIGLGRMYVKMFLFSQKKEGK